MQALLQRAIEHGLLRDIDYRFAKRICELTDCDDWNVMLGAALVSHRVGEGDVCLDINNCGTLEFFQHPALRLEISSPPTPQVWLTALQASPAVGGPDDYAPLILTQTGRLYLGRYWRFEQLLEQRLRAFAQMPPADMDTLKLKSGLDLLFPASDEGIDWQRVAAAIAVLRAFCVISGGPGTGKTRTVTSILALLLDQFAGQDFRIGLAAPTGKAAARLTESIRAAKQALALGSELLERIPEEAVTLHRLLGFRPGRAEPRHGRDNPLHLDLLLIDEASMVDLPMMARVFRALPKNARLILLGDKDQLSSVEAGRVLADISGRGASIHYTADQCQLIEHISGESLEPGDHVAPVADHIAVLHKSWRFDGSSGIGALAAAVNAGDADLTQRVLQDDAYPDVTHLRPNNATLNHLFEGRLVPLFRQLIQVESPEQALSLLNEIRVLCAVREGPAGVLAVNSRIEQILQREGLISSGAEHYAYRPIMITVNDHVQRLYNGDVGLILPDPDAEGALRVFFSTSEGTRRILPSRLPPHETVFAMTVHKSQGSEFNEVIMLIPDQESRTLTRELLYTGITRARRSVILVSDDAVLHKSVMACVKRSSGLFEALWSDSSR